MPQSDTKALEAEKKFSELKNKEEFRRKHAKTKLFIILVGGTLALAVTYIFSLTMGIFPLTFAEALRGVCNIVFNWGPSDTNMGEKIIYYLRMPRSICAICVGAGLAVAGAVMQALIKNPLVDPFITGVSSGASFGVVAITLGGFASGVMAGFTIPIAAIIGAIAAFSVTMFVAEMAGGKAMSYVLAGVIISTGLSSAITLMIYFNVKDYHMIMRWMFGSFTDLSWNSACIIFLGTLIPMAIAFLFSKKLNVMLLGEEQAMYLGIDVRTLKRGLMVLVAVLAAFCVAYCGVIGFVGLIIPHLCRMLIGGDHRLLIPSSAVVGGFVLLVADIFCKTAAAPSELPIGAVVAVLGVPFFLMLMVKEGKRYAM